MATATTVDRMMLLFISCTW